MLAVLGAMMLVTADAITQGVEEGPYEVLCEKQNALFAFLISMRAGGASLVPHSPTKGRVPPLTSFVVRRASSTRRCLQMRPRLTRLHPSL